LLTLLISKGIIMNRIMKGSSPEILWEIPPYRLPSMRAIVKKLGYRVRSFLKEAVPMVLAGVLVVNVLYMAGVIDMLAGIFAPVLSGLWGLPPETIPSLLIGFLRKDVAVGMLEPLDLTTKQLVISSTILAIYFPCAATFIIMVRELGAKDMLRAAVIMVFTTIIVGTLLNLLLWF
jgi:ferrous iron transport protein B